MASKKAIDSAWEKAKTIKGENPNVFRKDDFGNKIRKASYGTRGSMLGNWTIRILRQKVEAINHKTFSRYIGKRIGKKVISIRIR